MSKSSAAKTPKGLSESAEPHYIGHRERLRARFMESGGDSLPDYELLELVLFRAIPRRDVKGLAKALIKHFGSFAEVLGASPLRLLEVDGMRDGIVTELKIAEAAARRYTKGAVNTRTILSSWSAVMDYCRAQMAFEEREQFRLLFLDKKNGLIADEVLQRGTIDHTMVYPREVVRRALELSAAAIILLHNHPTGDPSPSRADIDMTQLIVTAALTVGISVLDHIIIARNGQTSFKGLKLL
jgi:DNA repair protein RadC